MICSEYRFTYLGERLLDFDEEMEAMPLYPAQQNVQTVVYSGARSASFFPRGGANLNVSFSRVVFFKTNSQAQLWAMSQQAYAPWQRSGELSIGWEDGSEVVMAGAVMEALDAEPSRNYPSPAAIVRYRFKVSSVEVRNSTAFEAGNWENIDSTWAASSRSWNDL